MGRRKVDLCRNANQDSETGGVLNALVQKQFLRERSNLFLVFVDFRLAFDCINHTLLWRKLFSVGLNGKIIRISRDMYDNAIQSKIKGNLSGLSRKIKITKGVLQGETLSPMLFNIFLSHIEIYFRKRDLTGIPINQGVDILFLLFADDMVVFADSYPDLVKKVGVLNYCMDNRLTKILILSKKLKY